MLKKVLKYIVSFSLIISTLSCLVASAYQISGFDISAKAAMLISLDTGEIIYEKNADNKMYPASLSKILSAVLIIEKTQDLDSEIITMTNEAANLISGTGSSVIGLKVGEKITARQALYGLMVSSGGDVSYAVALHYGGTVEGYMDMINAKAAEIGMKNSHFGNPVGLHDEETYTTPRDISVLAQYALQYSVFKEVTSTDKYTMKKTNMSGERTLITTNFLMNPTTNYYYKYASGVKTGFTDEAGRCVVSTASYSGYTYLCVIMGCENADGVRHEFIDSRELYRWAFNNFEYKSVLDTTKPVAEMPVELSWEKDHISLFPEKNLTKIMPNKADSSTIEIVPHLLYETVDAPIAAGTVLGTADIIYAGEIIGQVNLIAGEDTKANWILMFARFAKNFFSSVAFKIILAAIGIAVLIYIILCIRLNTKKRSHRKVKYIPYEKDK